MFVIKEIQRDYYYYSMPLTRLIILLSALLVVSPIMSQLAMASASHSSSHQAQSDDLSMGVGIVKTVDAVNECVCCDNSTAQSCPESGCECDACVTVLIHSLSPSQNPAPLVTNIGLKSQAPLDTILTIVVPPPISIL